MDRENLELLDKLGIQVSPVKATNSNTAQDEIAQPKLIDSAQSQALKRIAIIGGGSLLVLGVFLTIIQNTLDLGKMAKQGIQEQKEEQTELTLSDKDQEIAKLKAELAIKDQEKEIEQLDKIELSVDENNLPPVANASQELPSSAKKIPAPPAPKSSSTTKTIPTSRPLPRPVVPTTTKKTQIAQAPKVNPEQQWKTLSDFSLGMIPPGEAVLVASNIPERRNSSKSDVADSPFAPASSNVTTSGTTSGTTPGTRGIMSGSPIQLNNSSEVQPTESVVLNPTTIKAQISLPLVWNQEATSQQHNRFALTLKESITQDEKVIIPKGAVATAETTQVYANGVVDAHIIAITYADSTGQVISQDIPSGAIIVRNQKEEALLAKTKTFDDRNNNQILNGTIATLASVGEALAQPSNSTSITNTNGSLITSTSTNDQSLERRVAGAVLDGFFSNVQEGIAYKQEVSRRDTPVGGIFTLENGYDAKLIIVQPLSLSH